jgi:amino acid transporter
LKLVAVGVALFSAALLYRDIRSIGKISIVLFAGLLFTLGVIIWGGATHFNATRAFDFPVGAFHLSPAFFMGLGSATLISMYDYSGYFNVCLIGGEIRNPSKTIPRAVLYSIGILAVLYMAMSLSIIGVVPWREAIGSHAIVSDYVQRLYGPRAASLMTVMILWVAFASVFCVLLGYTRVPYAAAVEGHFFKIFARVHPKRHFPSFSVIFFGCASALSCLLSLEALIKALIVIQIVTQFAAQCLAVIAIRRNRNIARPFSMPLYPIPVILALLGWLFILGTSGVPYLISGFGLLAFGIAVYLWRAKVLGLWPWAPVVDS